MPKYRPEFTKESINIIEADDIEEAFTKLSEDLMSFEIKMVKVDG